MKKLQLLSLLFLAVLVMTGCANKELEKRVADLERRVVQLENGSSTTAQPLDINSLPTRPAVANNDQGAPEGPVPEFKFEKTEHDFGTIKEGTVAEHIFAFTNTGDAPLVISTARGSCGCTVPEWPSKPIPVGGTGEIKVKFDSKGRTQQQTKTVTLTANTYPKTTRLTIRAFVEPEGGNS